MNSLYSMAHPLQTNKAFHVAQRPSFCHHHILTMRIAAAATAVALATTQITSSEASSTTSLTLSILKTRGGASNVPENEGKKSAPNRARGKKKRRNSNKKASSKEEQKPDNIKDESESPSEPPAPSKPSPQEILIQELLQCDDYYEILGVGKTATATQIQKAYRRRAVQTHPDKVPNNDRRAFDKVAEAYDVLGNDQKRATYDRYGKQGLDATAEGRPPSSFTEDVFRSFFGSQFSSPFQQQREPRNRTVRYQLEVSLEELYNGVDKNVIVTEPGRKKVQVSIEPGMVSGQAIVLSGEMDHVADATPADLVFVLQQRPHPHFTRRGHDLAMELNISLQEAVCGMTRTIRHLDGRRISISSAKQQLGHGDSDAVSMLIQTGDVHVLKGEGMPKQRGGAHGDLYVQYKVEMPTQEAVNSLTPDEREQLGELLGKLERDQMNHVRSEGSSDANVQVLEKASPADFGEASGPFHVETDDFEEEHQHYAPRGFPFGGNRQFHFSGGAGSFFGGAFGGGRHNNRNDYDEDDDGSNVQCQQM